METDAQLARFIDTDGKSDPEKSSFLHRGFKWLSTLSENDSLNRLEASLESYRVELEQIRQDWIKHAAKTTEVPEPGWYTNCLRLLDIAEEAWRYRQADKAWEALHTAKRVELYAYQPVDDPCEKVQTAAGKPASEEGEDDPEPPTWGCAALRARAASILFESQEKLDGWRRKAVEHNLADRGGSLREQVAFHDVLASSWILTEAYANTYRRVRMTRRQFLILITIGIGAFAGWLIVMRRPGFSLDQPNELGWPWFWAAALFGVMGACTSGILSLANSSLKDKVPNKILQSWMTLARPVVGGLSAIALILFILSEFFVLEGVKMNAPQLLLVLAFAGGFSERLLTSTIQRL